MPSPLFLLVLRTISRFVLAALISTIVVFAAKTRLWEYTKQKVGSIFSINLEFLSNSGRRQITLRVPISEEARRLLESGETQTIAPSPNSATRNTLFPQQEEPTPPSPSSQGSRTAVDPTERREHDVIEPLNPAQRALQAAAEEGRFDQIVHGRRDLENQLLFEQENTPDWATPEYREALIEDIRNAEINQELFEREPTPEWFTPEYREAYSGPD